MQGVSWTRPTGQDKVSYCETKTRRLSWFFHKGDEHNEHNMHFFSSSSNNNNSWGNFINTQHAAPCDDCCIPEWEIKVLWSSYKLYCNYCIFSPWYQSAPKQRRDTLVSRIRAFFSWNFFCKSPGFYVPISGFESTVSGFRILHHISSGPQSIKKNLEPLRCLNIFILVVHLSDS